MSSLGFLVFALSELRIALPLSSVERVLQAAALSTLPGAPASILGLLNFRGRAIPVGDTRARFALPRRRLRASDVLILCRSRSRDLALAADASVDLLDCTSEDIVATDALIPGLSHIPGVLPGPAGCVLIHDLDRFLGLDEQRQLEEALRSV